MKNTKRGFIVPLLLILITVLLVGGGTYVYTQHKQIDQPTTENVELPQPTLTTQTQSNQIAPVVQNSNLQENKIMTIKYDQATPEQKAFLDKLTYKGSVFQKDELVLLYFDPVKNIAVVGSTWSGTNSTENYAKDYLDVGFFHPIILGPEPQYLPMIGGGPFVISCKDASTLSSTCSYVTDKHLVFFVTDDSLGPGGGSILAYTAGDTSFDEKLLKESTDFYIDNLGGTYVKEYTEDEGPILDTFFDGKKITASVYEDYQYLGMGSFDLTKTNKKLKTVTFELN